MDVFNVFLQGGFICNGMIRSECEGEVIFVVFVGNDIMVVGLIFMCLKVYCVDEIQSMIWLFMFYFMVMLYVYVWFKKEIKEVVEQGKVLSLIINEEVQKLFYMQVVMYEIFCIGNVVIFGYYKVVLRGGDMFVGYYLFGGINIGYNILGLMYNKKFFGEDVDIFWLE